MTQSLTESRTDVAQATSEVDHLERDREAWNLPRAPVDTVSDGADQDELDWDGFRDLHFPGSRRHSLGAIVAYGAYKRSPLAGGQPAGEAARVKGDAISTEALSLAEWEDEGGTSH
jgi:hypothetical protein